VEVQGQQPFSSVLSHNSASSVIHFLALQPQSLWPIGKQENDPALSPQARGWSAFADHECVREGAMSAGWKSLPHGVTPCVAEDNCVAQSKVESNRKRTASP
jgi:hypothetical protein